jgi:glycosyltransferase involved in cell wall biosynthesis
MDKNPVQMPLKKILCLIPNFGYGGAQRVFGDLGKQLSEKYNTIDCVFNLDEENIHKSGNRVISLEIEGGGRAKKILNFFLRCYKLNKLCKSEKIDICISHMDGANLVNILSLGHQRKILCVHGSANNDPNKRGLYGFFLNFFLIPLVYKRADLIITVSKGIRSELIALGISSKKILAIPNFFNVAGIDKLSEEALSDDHSSLFNHYNVIITSGRLSLQKNQAAMLHIVKGMDRKRTKAKLVILGEGELKNDLVRLATSMNLKIYIDGSTKEWNNECDVFLLGHQTNPFKFLSKARLFILTSYFEGFPLVIGEALICGVTCVSVDCPTGPREILAPQTDSLSAGIVTEEYGEYGILMPNVDTPANQAKFLHIWSNALEGLINNSELLNSYRSKGIERMKAFETEKIIQRWEQIIDHE